MTDFGESVMGWLPRAAGAALVLLGAACTSAFQSSPPLAGNGAIVESATAQTNLEDLLNAPARGTNNYGYLNQQVTPTSYRTLFLAKLKPTYAVTIKQRNVEAEQFEVFAIDMTYLQAAKLALDSGYAGFTSTAPESFLHVIVKNNHLDDPTYRSCVETCQILNCGCVPTYYDYATLGTPAGLGTYGHYDLIDARALLSFDMTKDVATGAYDAKATIDKMHKQYPFLTAGSGEPADTTPGATATPGATPPEPQPTPPSATPSESQPVPPADIPPAPPPKHP
jgi:hypothetical protein